MELHENYFSYLHKLLVEWHYGVPLRSFMKIEKAVVDRMLEIAENKKMSICDICLKAGMSPSNIYDLIHKRTKYSKINTIQKFCEGAGVTLGYFFSTKVFDNIEPED